MSKIMEFLQREMNVPGPFSWFHIIALILIVIGAVLVSFKFKNCNEKTYKRILLIGWIVVILLEIPKQFIKSYHPGAHPYWEYSYRDFPFQLCSMIYYLTPIILFVNKEKHPKIVDAAVGFMSFTSLVGALIVLAYPAMVTSNFIYINFQTFIHHGTQVILGVFIYVWNRKSITIKTFYRSLIVFAISAVIAVIINVIFHPHFINMFFINPLIITNVPIGKTIQEKAGYVVFLISYLSAMTLATFLTYITETSIYKQVLKRK